MAGDSVKELGLVGTTTIGTNGYAGASSILETLVQHTFTISTLSLLAIASAAQAAPVETPTAPPAAEPTAVVAPPAAAAALTSSATHAKDAKWGLANPEQPDGPQMVGVQGNPKDGAFVALAKFPAGFAAPLHSHPANFAGAVLSGTVVNGRSAEDNVKLTGGTAWTEPAGAVHYTGCTDEADCIVALHMDGAMGMTPADAPAEGDLKMVVSGPDSIEWTPINPERPEGPKMFVISGDKEAGAFRALVKLPAGSTSPEHSHSSTYSAAVLAGAMVHGTASDAVFGVGSYWTEAGGQVHVTGCSGEVDCVFFASMDGAFDMVMAKPAEAPAAE